MPTVNSLCNKYLYIHNKFPVEKRVNRRHFYIDEKNLQKFGLTGELLSVGSYYMRIPSFQSQILVLHLVKWWLTVENCVNRCFKVLNHS